MPNAIAFFMLAVWPLATALIMRRLPLERAIIWTILGGYLILPPVASFDPPLVPDLDKASIPNLSLLFFLLFMLKKKVPFLPRNFVARGLVVVFVIGVIPTILTNGDPIVFQLMGQADPIVFFVAELPGTGSRDLISVVVTQLIVLIPFLVAREYLSTPQGLRELLVALVIGGLIYALPALLETRLSPQLNIWIYGFFQHDFQQMIRGNGYRPIVFLQHGLWVAFFFMTAAVSAATLAKVSDGDLRRRYAFALVAMLVLVVAAKSLGSQVYTLLLVPLALFTKPRIQVRIAVTLVVIAVIYPILRQYHLIPLDGILDMAESISADRAQSLGYRFNNEEQLLARAQERPLFGWGVWGRNLVRDMTTGRITSIPDGEWIILFGTFGWLGYLTEMGLLALPIILIAACMRRRQEWPEDRIVAAVVLLLAITMTDMLVNAIITPYTWLIAGALLGYAERVRAAAKAPVDAGRRAIIGDVSRSRT